MHIFLGLLNINSAKQYHKIQQYAEHLNKWHIIKSGLKFIFVAKNDV